MTLSPDDSASPETAGAAADAQGLSRADYIFHALREEIRTGRLRQGMRLRDDEIAKRFGVSRTPVREALSRILARGLAEVSPNRNLMVTILSGARVIELYRMRGILEGASARFAAEHASGAEIAVLRGLALKSAEAGDSASSAHFNRQFHMLMHEVSRNRFLTTSINDIYDFVALLPGTGYQVAGRQQEAHAEHGRIIDAIAKGDGDAAETAARLHTQKAGEFRMELLLEEGWSAR